MSSEFIPHLQKQQPKTTSFSQGKKGGHNICWSPKYCTCMNGARLAHGMGEYN